MPIVSFRVLVFTAGSCAVIAAKHRSRSACWTGDAAAFWAFATPGATMSIPNVRAARPADRTDTITSVMNELWAARILRV